MLNRDFLSEYISQLSALRLSLSNECIKKLNGERNKRSPIQQLFEAFRIRSVSEIELRAVTISFSHNVTGLNNYGYQMLLL